MALRFTYPLVGGLAAALRTQLNSRGLNTSTIHSGDTNIIVTIPSSAAGAAVKQFSANQLAPATRIETVSDGTPGSVSDPTEADIIVAASRAPT